MLQRPCSCQLRKLLLSAHTLENIAFISGVHQFDPHGLAQPFINERKQKKKGYSLEICYGHPNFLCNNTRHVIHFHLWSRDSTFNCNHETSVQMSLPWSHMSTALVLWSFVSLYGLACQMHLLAAQNSWIPKNENGKTSYFRWESLTSQQCPTSQSSCLN